VTEIQYETVVLQIPFQDGEKRPSQWDFTSLLGTRHPIQVISEPSARYRAAVVAHPDFAFGTIFLSGDFPNNKIPSGFNGHVEEDMLTQYGNELIYNEYGPASDSDDEPYCDECGADTPPTCESAPGTFHELSCSLHTDTDSEPSVAQWLQEREQNV
jgi:hypothetical protein